MIIKQYNYNNYTELENDTLTNCKVGVSISEDDYLSYEFNKQEQEQPEGKEPYPILRKQGFYFELIQDNQNVPIYLGSTFKYQSDTFLDSVTFNFPKQPPKSILIQILQKE